MTKLKLLQILARGEDSRHQFKRDETNADAIAAELAAAWVPASSAPWTNGRASGVQGRGSGQPVQGGDGEAGAACADCGSGRYRPGGNLSSPASYPASWGVACPVRSFIESDFVALFEPAGKVQGPKMRAAIRSLRLAKLAPTIAPKGFIEKINQSKANVEKAEREQGVSSRLDDPTQEFDVQHLVAQIEQECVYPDTYGRDSTKWGKEDGNFSHCLSLIARINGVLTSPAFACVFQANGKTPLVETISKFLDGKARLLRICLSGVSYEYHAREIIANVIGRYLLKEARAGKFSQRPVVTLERFWLKCLRHIRQDIAYFIEASVSI